MINNDIYTWYTVLASVFIGISFFILLFSAMKLLLKQNPLTAMCIRGTKDYIIHTLAI